jgi:1,2-diacylglycerol 3-alpha-glucosyltransferase
MPETISASSQEVPHTSLRIAMICDGVTDFIAGGYISTQQFADELVKRGNHVIFITSNRSNERTQYGDIKLYRFRGIPVPKTNKQIYVGFPTIAEIEKVLKDEKIDVVHIMMPMPSAVSGTMAAERLSIPIVIHSHFQPENIFIHAPALFPSHWFIRLVYAYLRWLYKKADIIVYPTEFARQQFKWNGLKPDDIVITNGVDIRRFVKMDATEFRKRHNISPESKVILFVARLEPEKCADILIRATPTILKSIPHAHVLIVGGGSEHEKLVTLSEKLGVTDHITLAGRVSNEDLVLAYNASDLFVLPSLAELEGMVVLEAMACGLPILIANSKESASVYFVDGNGLLFKPNDPDDLASQAIRILNDDVGRQKMAEASHAMSRKYDLQESINTMEQVYRSVLTQSAH